MLCTIYLNRFCRPPFCATTKFTRERSCSTCSTLLLLSLVLLSKSTIQFLHKSLISCNICPLAHSVSLSLSTEFDRAKMSNRYSSNRQEGNKEGFGKTHKKFIPKNQSSSPKEPNPNPNSNPTLSTSLRQSLSKQSDGATTSSSVEAPTTTRIRMGENGEWVPTPLATA
jgi:hypothetical protein